MMNHKRAFGAALKKLRLAKNYSQIELAKLSKIDRTFISLLERGVRQPTLATILQLSSALGVKPSQLITEFEDDYRRKRWHRLNQK